jgi:inosine/xanthosine triphosphatase
MKFFVGSTNPVKVNAVLKGAIDRWPEVQVEGFAVDSGVKEQPISDEETKKGAINRAKKALKLGLKLESKKVGNSKKFLGIGLEGGVWVDEENQMWTTVWAAVVDQELKPFVANGVRFKVDKIVANKILQGEEMGPIMSLLCNGRSVKTQEGLIGIVTNNFVDRTEEYAAVVKLALGLWYGRNWTDKLVVKKY